MSDLHDRVQHVTGYDLAAMAKSLGELVEEREKKRAAWEWWKEMKKPVLAQASIIWAQSYRDQNGKEPALALSERGGLASQMYRDHINALKVAHEDYAVALSKAKQAEEELWAARTQISFLKHEMQNA